MATIICVLNSNNLYTYIYLSKMLLKLIYLWLLEHLKLYMAYIIFLLYNADLENEVTDKSHQWHKKPVKADIIKTKSRIYLEDGMTTMTKSADRSSLKPNLNQWV